MWVRKPEREIQAVLAAHAERQKSLLLPARNAALIATFFTIAYALGLRACTRSVVVVAAEAPRFSTRTLIGVVVVFAIQFLIFFAVALYFQRHYGGFTSREDVLLCRECYTSSHRNVLRRCTCGGGLEPFDFFDWVDDGTTSRTSQTPGSP